LPYSVLMLLVGCHEGLASKKLAFGMLSMFT